MRARARVQPGIYACGAGARGSFLRTVLCFVHYTRACAHAHAHAHIRERKKKSARGRGRACVYIASLECVSGVWIRRSPEIERGCCAGKKKKRKHAISFCSRLHRSDRKSRVSPYSCRWHFTRRVLIACYTIFLSRSLQLTRSMILIDDGETVESLKFQSSRNTDS